MRISTLLHVIVTLLAFSIYFYAIDPFLHKRWLAFILFFLIFMSLHYLTRKVEALHLEFLEKRLDKMLSLLIICLLFMIFYIIGLAF